MEKLCAAYIRVSTHDQEEYSPESQLRLIRDYAGKNGMTLPEAFIFRDDGISGRTAEKRPGFMQMIATAKQKPRPFQCILVWKFSRFARNQEESVVYKSLLKKENGIDVISISEPLMDGPFGGLIERIIEWFDAFYSANLGVEVRRGMAERAGRGLPVSAAPLGYAYQNKALVAVPEEASTVQMIYRDFLAGGSVTGIARKLNSLGIRTKRGGAWESRTVRYILANPVYTGKLRWCTKGANDYHGRARKEGTMLVEGAHKPLISPKDFQDAQARLEECRRCYEGTGTRSPCQDARHMLQGLVRCGACGGTLTYTGPGMNCSRYVHGKCQESHFIPEEKLDRLVLAAIQAHLGSLGFRLIRRQRPRAQEERLHLTQRIKKEEEALSRHKAAYAAGVDSLAEYRQNKAACQDRLQKLAGRLKQLEAPSPPAEEHGDVVEALGSDRLSPAEKNGLLRSFIQYIVFYKEPRRLEIVYRI